ncbi:MAG: hypothetical protein Q7J21_03850 [Rugosibacter sp.]|nr:hypothetical protein [Rugosibacter sp.]
MWKHVMLSLGVVTLMACSPSKEEVSGDQAEEMLMHDASILTWAHDQHGDTVHAQTFYGDFTGDGLDDALAWVLYPSGGNSEFLDVALFRNEGGRVLYYRSIDNVFGGDPRDVVFEQGRITLTTTMPNPGDPRCCPTGSRNWAIDTK